MESLNQQQCDEQQEENKQEIVIFTDGACKRNGTQTAISSIGIYFPDKQFADYSEILPILPHTNQRAELYAIIKALEITESMNIPVTIYTDSLYCFNIITIWIETWMKHQKTQKQIKSNWDLITILHAKIQNRIINMKHIRGHQKINKNISLESHENKCVIGNNNADKLATNAIKTL